ncbi:unnamed protein product [Adineta steineri]|uniref:Uncharacterized protein n=1 Tax=Adineta steineri TaxID=433720 RepID=A0A815NGT1_9BILA|nr:unnamed protein product [Adineta steineri]CAF4065999.1 unnamed protein product [Adineta steineri]
MVLEAFVFIIKSEKALKYKCTSSDLCNNEIVMKSLLDSLVFEERFPEEFNTLIQGAPFDNNTAATCFRYANTSFECEMPSLESCERCTIDVYQSSKGNQDICASCERLIEGNGILRNTTYLFDDRAQLDDIHIGCERPGCNSIENINKIRQFSTVTFDFDKFFGTPSSSATLLNISILFLIFFMTFQLCFIC